MIAALYALSALATVLAWMLARRNRDHLPIAVLLSVCLGVDVARRVLRTLYIIPVIRPLRGTPLSGTPLAMAHLNDALFLVQPAALAACALVVFTKRRPWPAVVVYLLFVAGMVAFHPTESSGALPRVLSAAEILSLLVALGCAATWYVGPSKQQTTTAQASLAIVIAGELASLVGSWRIGVFDNWHITQILYLLLYLILVVLQGGFLWQSRSR